MYIGLECPALPGVANGRIVYSPPDCTVTVNCLATYQCEPGYQLQRERDVAATIQMYLDSIRVCDANEDLTAAVWTGVALKCVFSKLSSLPHQSPWPQKKKKVLHQGLGY